MSVTVCHKFLETAKKHKDKTAVMYKRSNRWIEETWGGYNDMVHTIAAGLQTLGVRKGDRVAIFANTSFEWAATDFAVLGLGAITVPIYQSSTPDDISFILENSGARVFVCESPAAIRKVRPLIKGAKSIEKVIFFNESRGETALDSTPEKSIGARNNSQLAVAERSELTLSEVQALGEKALKKSPTLFELAVNELRADTVATLIYTSGTTGQPKGAILTHAQALSEVIDTFPLLGVTPKDRSLSFLPYAHVLGRIEIWGHGLIGYTMAFAENIDRVRDNMVDVKPTIMVAVPRIFEKIYNVIIAQAESSPIQKKIFEWALAVGREISKYKIEKMPVPLDLAIKYQIAKRSVFDKISAKLGGDLRFAVCGGAPLSRPIAEFFHAAGLLILEGYGLTETTGALAVNTPFDYRFGTVGKAIGEVKIKLGDDDEILVNSKKVCTGYWRNDQATSEAFTDGWFHTGDIGEISPEGYLRITDRKKDLIKTSGGKYVAPQKLEGLLKASHYLSQVHIHGDQKKYIVALITLNNDAILKYAESQKIPGKDAASIAGQPKIRELIRGVIAEANSHLASYETIKNFAILPRDFTVESGELTPSLKVKRKIVDSRYVSQIDALYL